MAKSYRTYLNLGKTMLRMRGLEKCTGPEIDALDAALVSVLRK